MPVEPAHDKLTKALFMVEGVVAKISADGICAREIAVSLACEMNRQVEIAIKGGIHQLVDPDPAGALHAARKRAYASARQEPDQSGSGPAIGTARQLGVESDDRVRRVQRRAVSPVRRSARRLPCHLTGAAGADFPRRSYAAQSSHPRATENHPAEQRHDPQQRQSRREGASVYRST